MRNLFNILAGMGSALNAFGTLPQYDVPQRGDSARDLKVISCDFRRITNRVESNARAVLAGNNNGPTHHRKANK